MQPPNVPEQGELECLTIENPSFWRHLEKEPSASKVGVKVMTVEIQVEHFVFRYLGKPLALQIVRPNLETGSLLEIFFNPRDSVERSLITGRFCDSHEY